jgi:hypothetical protein
VRDLRPSLTWTGQGVMVTRGPPSSPPRGMRRRGRGGAVQGLQRNAECGLRTANQGLGGRVSRKDRQARKGKQLDSQEAGLTPRLSIADCGVQIGKQGSRQDRQEAGADSKGPESPLEFCSPWRPWRHGGSRILDRGPASGPAGRGRRKALAVPNPVTRWPGALAGDDALPAQGGAPLVLDEDLLRGDPFGLERDDPCR